MEAKLSIDGCDYTITRNSCPELFYHIKKYHESAQNKEFSVRVNGRNAIVNPFNPLITQLEKHLPPLEFGYKFWYKGHEISMNNNPIQMSMKSGAEVLASAIINSSGQWEEMAL